MSKADFLIKFYCNIDQRMVELLELGKQYKTEVLLKEGNPQSKDCLHLRSCFILLEKIKSNNWKKQLPAGLVEY